MHEIDVIRSTRHFLRTHGLLGYRALDLYTDAHPTLLADQSLRPFQRFTLAFEGFVAHPDLVGRLADGETTFALEVKGASDLLKGIAQAELYRAGFHLVLFAGAGRPAPELLRLARRHDIGVLAVTAERTEIIELPPPHLPQLRHAEGIRAQFVTSATLQRQFSFNLPTHYLCFAPLLSAWKGRHGIAEAPLADLEPFARRHYAVLPQGRDSFRAALAGAEKLGLVRIQGRQVSQTIIGQASAELLPDAPALAALHRQLARRGAAPTLAALNPAAGAVLRSLLYADPVARFIVERLAALAGLGPLTMRTLVTLSAEYDKTHLTQYKRAYRTLVRYTLRLLGSPKFLERVERTS